VIPVLSGAAMRAADAVAVSHRGADALVNAAGTAVALEAQRMLGSCYGKRVSVIVGPGLNGADGRIAAVWLASRGARVDVIEVIDQPGELRPCHLLIDAAFGLGCSRPYAAPIVQDGTRVLSVDLPSGVESDSGQLLGTPIRADVTIALGALKYAHLTGPAAPFCGELRFAGLDIVHDAEDGLVEDHDLDHLIMRDANDHKWMHAVSVFAGSPPMPGAAELVSRGALAGGASMIRLATRGDAANFTNLPPEVVRSPDKFVDRRSRVVIAGPGLGEDAAAWLSKRLIDVRVPVVLDADGLDRSLLSTAAAADRRWVLTPHEGEFARLTDGADITNRIAAVRDFARESGCVILLKGPTSIVANPEGQLRIVRSGTSALATAGTGDVLSGLIGATIARGHDVLAATAMAAHLHGMAGARLPVYAPASGLLAAISEILGEVAQRAEYVGTGGDHGEFAARSVPRRRTGSGSTSPNDRNRSPG
jgi:hydroxyethylthiazole kinase-like uncharacterized protein yjeF